ncbi:hypothetical protein [Sporosarcina sp. NPDC096371]
MGQWVTAVRGGVPYSRCAISSTGSLLAPVYDKMDGPSDVMF